jgi:hypothetical protein
MSSLLRSGLMLAVFLLAFLFVIPWDRLVPWPFGSADIEPPQPAGFTLAASESRPIHETDAALIAREPPDALPGSRDDPADWANEDRINAHIREVGRADLLDKLTQPSRRWCSGSDRKALTDAVRYYYDMRHRQIAAFSKRGPNARAYVVSAWSGAEDQRIDGLVRDFVADGYLKPADIPANVGADLASALRAARPGIGCPRKA